MRVTHLIPQAGLGGATRALLGVARATESHSHSAVSLRPAGHGVAADFEGAGVRLTDSPEREQLTAELTRADVVHVHFWNSPELYELLGGHLPPMRLVIWSHVGGDEAPQVLVPALADVADLMVASTPYTARLPALAGSRCRTIEPIPEPSRRDPLPPHPHRGFAVGYVGTVDPVKMHPRFTSISASIDVPDVRFVVCGTGDGFREIASEAEALGARERFDLRGFIADIGPVLAELDVFGYPLSPGNYSALELVLVEAMYAGVPPVVLANGAAAATVRDGVTGIVASDEKEYVAAIERLAADRDLRSRLAEGARAEAARRWSEALFAERWADAYAKAMEGPKLARSAPGWRNLVGAELFIAALGKAAEPFRASLGAAGCDSAVAADEAVRAVPRVVARSDGGVLDYRRRFPEDPHLRLWSGLVLAESGDRVLAAGELAAARRLGVEECRVAPRITAITEELARA